MVKNKLDFHANIRNNLKHNAFQGIFHFFRGVHLWRNTKSYVLFHVPPARNVRSIAAAISIFATPPLTKAVPSTRSGSGS